MGPCCLSRFIRASYISVCHFPENHISKYAGETACATKVFHGVAKSHQHETHIPFWRWWECLGGLKAVRRAEGGKRVYGASGYLHSL